MFSRRVLNLFVFIFISLVVLLLCYGVVHSEAQTYTASITALDPARLRGGVVVMDMGGASDGVQVYPPGTNGDIFQLHYAIPSPLTTTNYISKVQLPAGLRYVASSANVISGALSVGLTTNYNVGTGLLTFNFTTTNTTNAVDLVFKLYADLTTVPGDKSMSATITSSSPANTKTVKFPLFSVYPPTVGNSKTPQAQSQFLGAVATWTVTVSNPGLGGAFNVTLSEAGIGAGLQLLSMTPVPPLVPSVVTADSLVIPYMGYKAQYSVIVT